MKSSSTRREFVVKVSASGVVLLLASIQASTSSASASSASTSSAAASSAAEGSLFKENKKIKVGLIGCGSVSNRYLPHLKAYPRSFKYPLF